jgi:UDPglucose 6-dehydrogenase
MSNKNKPSIGVLGLWHLGSVYSCALADAGYPVTGYDLDKQTVSELNKGIPPIFEPGLEQLLKKNQKKKLVFVSNPKEAIGGKDYIFITLDIPVSENDQSNLRDFNKLFDLVVKYGSRNSIVVISSQLPLGTSRELQKILTLKKRNMGIIYFPENLRLGTAINNFLNPDRIVLGCNQNAVSNRFKKDFSLFSCPIVEMSLDSAEMTKHSLNAYLATLISFTSEICDICDSTDANYNDVLKALRTDVRVGNLTPINPGTGFAGGTLGRDVKTLLHIAKRNKLTVGQLEGTITTNKFRIAKIQEKIKALVGQVKNKQIGILGLTYKPNTSSLRRSLSLQLAQELKTAGATVSAYDPAITGDIPNHPYIETRYSLESFFIDLDLVIIMTPWDVFKSIGNKELSRMKSKAIYDPHNMLVGRELGLHKYACTGLKIL